MTNLKGNHTPKTNPARQINYLARLLTRYFDKRLASIGVNVAYLPVLGALQDVPQLSQKELTEIGWIGQPAMAQMLGKMVKEGLLIRTADESDGRKALFALSHKARKSMQRVGMSLTEGNEEIFSVLGADGLETLNSLLAKLERQILRITKADL